MIIDEKDLKKFSEQRIEGLNLKPNKNMPLNYKFQECRRNSKKNYDFDYFNWIFV